MRKLKRSGAFLLMAGLLIFHAPHAGAQGKFSIDPQDKVPPTGVITPLRFPTTIAPTLPSHPAAKTEAAPAKAEPAKAPVADATPKGWKPVNFPRPPVLDKKLRIAAAKADKEKAAKEKAARLAKKSDANADTKIDGTTEAKADTKSDAKSEAKPVASVAAPAKAPEVVPGIPAVAPPAPKATGIFALFTQGSGGAPSGGDADSSRVVLPDSASGFARLEGPSTRVSGKISALGLPNPVKKKRSNNGAADDDLEDEETSTGIEKQVASVQTACLKTELTDMIREAGQHFGGTPVITSGYRSHGRRGSYHRRCAAADFIIPGVTSSQLVSYLRKLPGAGGVGTYCHTKSVHLDTGTPRNWHQCGFHRSFALRTPIVAAK